VDLFRYVSQHMELGLEQEPNYDFMGHPINAYHFVRHVASGWKIIQDGVLSEDVFTINEDLESLKDRETHQKLPDEYDVQGGAHGLVRLHSLYRLNLESFSKEGRMSTTLDNGKVVYSQPSVLKFNCKY
jgi:hypothetical protein